jgi:hypothetical protein
MLISICDHKVPSPFLSILAPSKQWSFCVLQYLFNQCIYFMDVNNPSSPSKLVRVSKFFRKDGELGNNIRPIDKTSVHRICSGQVIFDISSGVKELVENSLDAKATYIEIRLRDFGKEAIEVLDNGSGIAPSDYDFVGT